MESIFADYQLAAIIELAGVCLSIRSFRGLAGSLSTATAALGEKQE
jgi:hypothetical protein